MRHSARFTAVLLSSSIASCALFDKDDSEPIGELPEVKNRIAVIEPWDAGVGEEIEQRFLSIYPRYYQERIYTTDDEGNISAFEAEKGKRVWRTELEDVGVTAGVAGGDGALAVGTDEGAVIALNPKDGRELWRTELTSEVVAIADSTKSIVAVRTLDGKLYGLDPTSGEQLWQHARKTPVLTLKGGSRPVVSGAKVVAGMDNGKVIAVSAARGKLLWETTLSSPRGRSELERMVDIDGDIVVQEGIVYAASFQGDIGAIALSDGRGLWAREFSSFSGLAADEERIYVTDAEGQIWAFDRRTGAAQWKQAEIKTRRLTRPAVVGPYLLVGDAEGYIHWLSVSDGQFVARQRAGSKPLVSAPIAAGARAYALESSGDLAALEFVPKLGIAR